MHEFPVTDKGKGRTIQKRKMTDYFIGETLVLANFKCPKAFISRPFLEHVLFILWVALLNLCVEEPTFLAKLASNLNVNGNMEQSSD